MQSMLAFLGNSRGMPHIMASCEYLKKCNDDLNAKSRKMRQFLEDTSELVYGPGLWIEVDTLKERFEEWKHRKGLRNIPGEGPSFEQEAAHGSTCFSHPSNPACLCRQLPGVGSPHCGRCTGLC